MATNAGTIPRELAAFELASTLAERSRPRILLGDVHIDRVDLDGAVERIDSFLRSEKPHQVVTVNLDFLRIAEQNIRFRDAINSADLAVADGMPLVWLSRLLRQPLPQRVAGVDLVHESCALAARAGRGVFLLGGRPGVANAAALRLKAGYPGLQVSAYSPPFGPLRQREQQRIVDIIRAAEPGCLFVALGAPRQDLWIHDNLELLEVPVMMGVGCVLDLLAGVVNRAPGWMQHAGLEWAFRLAQEPNRLWRRYILEDIPTLGRLLTDAVVSL